MNAVARSPTCNGKIALQRFVASGITALKAVTLLDDHCDIVAAALACSTVACAIRHVAFLARPSTLSHRGELTSNDFPSLSGTHAATMIANSAGLALVASLTALFASTNAVPTVNVALRTSFGAPPYLVELLFVLLEARFRASY